MARFFVCVPMAYVKHTFLPRFHATPKIIDRLRVVLMSRHHFAMSSKRVRTLTLHLRGSLSLCKLPHAAARNFVARAYRTSLREDNNFTASLARRLAHGGHQGVHARLKLLFVEMFTKFLSYLASTRADAPHASCHHLGRIICGLTRVHASSVKDFRGGAKVSASRRERARHGRRKGVLIDV